MSRVVHFNIRDILPEQEFVFQHQGISRHAEVNQRILDLYDHAVSLFINRARPVGLVFELTPDEFAAIYAGEGENAVATPLVNIYPLAENLALYALTIGSEVSRKIEELFRKNDFAMGAMLDSVASIAADKTVEVLESNFYRDLRNRQLATEDDIVLSYSPGYCGWHITAQKKLFQNLKPEQIGITLNESCLMTPLKSVSGVLVAGKKEIHIFENIFPFCDDCTTLTCRKRMKTLVVV